MNQRLIIRILISLSLLLPFLLHAGGHWEWQFLERIENIAYDLRVQMTMPGSSDDRVVIVDIDEKSLTAEGQWPWPRDTLARLLDSLFERYETGVVGFDMTFPEPDLRTGTEILDRLAETELADDERYLAAYRDVRPGLETDRIFSESLAGRRTVMGFVFHPALGEESADLIGAIPEPVIREDEHQTDIDFITAGGYTGNLPILQDKAFDGGFFDNPTVDQDGVFRRVPVLQAYEGDLYQSLALAVYRAYTGQPEIEFVFGEGLGTTGRRTGLDLEWLRVGERRIPVDEELTVLVPYRGSAFTFPYVSATDVIHGEAPEHLLKDKIVLIGTSAPGLQDNRVTPVAQVFPGVEVHANIISGILDERMKHHPQYIRGVSVVGLVFIAVIMTWLIPRFSVTGATLLGLGLMLAIGVGNLLLWEVSDLVVPVAGPIAFTAFLLAFQMVYGYLIEARGKRRLAGRFGQYVPPELVEEMDEEKGASFSMEGEIRRMTVMFSDVRSFTSISEQMEPKQLTQYMNEFLTAFTRIVHRHRGTIDKYMGDAMMAFWGAPLEDEDHARHAVIAGLEMLGALGELNRNFRERGWPEIRIGVGLNTGEMRVGNMGSEFRMAYTVMGDPVNLGSRLEGLTKEYGASMIVSEFTKDEVPDYAFMELDRVRVKGKEKPVAIYEPLGTREGLDKDTKSMLRRYKQALAAYREQRWDDAEREFFMLSNEFSDRPIFAMYLERVNHFRKEPPPADWDGVFTFTHK